MPVTDSKGRAQLTPADALKAGWRSWIVLLLVSAGGLIAVLAFLPMSDAGGGSLAGVVVVGVAIAWLVLLAGLTGQTGLVQDRKSVV